MRRGEPSCDGPFYNRQPRQRASALNYRHAYHAGNFADVHKHAVLVALIRALQAKDAPLCYLDTHAGRGRYDLRGEQALKTLEHRDGIGRLFGAAGLPPALTDYLALVAACNAGAAVIETYPGSPLLVRQMLRADDRAILCELHEEEAAALKALFRDDARIAVHRRDGYAALGALLPPTPRRGLVLIDPPFEEQAGEFAVIETALQTALARWPGGVYAIWYPIKRGTDVVPFHRWLTRCGCERVLAAEVLLRAPDSPLRLNGSGIAIVNPPWQIERALAPALDTLARLLGDPGAGHAELNWLAGP